MQGGAPIMERLPPSALLASTSSAQSGAQGGAQSVTWVPDEEVQECPGCSRTFGYSLRKHHCRACGRVICGYCSNNTLSITGHGKKDRVCDTCFDLRRHDTTSALADDQSNMVLVEQSLKADLKLKHQQAEWFRSFLVRISADTAKRSAGEPAADVGEGPRSPNTSFCGDEEGEELIANARRNWKDVCEDLSKREAETERMRKECEELERQVQRHQAGAQELQRDVKNMEGELRRRPQVEAERDQLQLRANSLEQELDGLTQRKANLEANRPSPPGSFLGNWSNSSGSFQGSFGQLQDRVRGCTNQCRQQ